jgi:hypothetical protein
VQDFAADIQRSMETELASHEAAATAQARLRYARARLDELRAINAERQRRVDEVVAEAARLQVPRIWAGYGGGSLCLQVAAPLLPGFSVQHLLAISVCQR